MRKFISLLMVTFVFFIFKSEAVCIISGKMLFEQMERKNDISEVVLEYNEYLHGKVRNLVRSAQIELVSKMIFIPNDINISFYFLGSLARKTALVFSDLEFGIIVSEKTDSVREYINNFMQIFYKKLKKEGIVMDENGWHPPFIKDSGWVGKTIFLATPDEFIKFIQKKKKPRIIGSLIQSCFFCGDKKLYDKCFQKELGIDFHKCVKEEFYQTKKYIETKLKKLIVKENNNKIKNIDFKYHITKPVEELIFYLAQYYQISFEGSFDLIKKLESANYISKEQRKKLREALSYGIKKRLFYDDKDVIISKFSKTEFSCLQNHIIFIFSFLSFVESII